MIWISMPESVEEKCYGCRGVTDEEGRPKFLVHKETMMSAV